MGFKFLERWIIEEINSKLPQATVKVKTNLANQIHTNENSSVELKNHEKEIKEEEEKKRLEEEQKRKKEEEEQKKKEVCTEIKKLVDEENEKLEEQYKGLPKVFGKVFLKFDENNFSVSTVLSNGWQVQRKCGNFSINCKEIAGTNANKKDILNEVKKYIEKFKETNTEQIEATKKLMKKVEELNEASNEYGMGFKLECAGHPDNSILCLVTPTCDDDSIGREMYAFSLNYSPGAKDLTVKQPVEENLKLVDRMQELIASMNKANESLKKDLPAYHKKGFSFFVSRDGRLFFATEKVKSSIKEQDCVLKNRNLIANITLSDKKFEGDMGEKYTKIDTKELSDKLDEIENNGLFLGYINKKYILPENVIERCKRFSEVKSIAGEYNEKLKELGDKKRFFVSIGTRADMLRNYGELDKVSCFTKEEKEEQESCFPVVYMVVNSGNNNEYQVEKSFTVFNEEDGKVNYDELRNKLGIILKKKPNKLKKKLSNGSEKIDKKVLNGLGGTVINEEKTEGQNLSNS